MEMVFCLQGHFQLGDPGLVNLPVGAAEGRADLRLETWVLVEDRDVGLHRIVPAIGDSDDVPGLEEIEHLWAPVFVSTAPEEVVAALDVLRAR